MYTLLICAAIGVAYGLLSSWLSGGETRSRKNALTKVVFCTAVMLLFGCLVAGKYVRESIPLREFVSAEVAIGAPRNPDGSIGAFVTSRKDSDWEFRLYVYHAKLGETGLVQGIVPYDFPVVVVEDASLTDSGVLSVYEREREPTHSNNDWAIFQSTDKRVTKYVFKIPPGKMVILPAR